MLAIGKNALYFEDYVLSIQYFNQVIRSKPHLAEPYLYRAVAKFCLDDFKGAENDLTLCIERNPFLWYAYQCRGASRQNQGNFAGAIEDYEKGLEFHPEDRQMLLNKSIAYVQLKDYDSAITTLTQLVKLQPKYTNAILTLGAAYEEKGDTLLAIENYNKAINVDKYYAPSYAQRALLYYKQENYTDALKDLDEAIRLETKQVGYHINRGLMRYYLNDLKGAMSDYDIVINLDSKNTVALFNRGLLRSNVGDIYGAIEDFDQVIKFESDNYMAVYNRAILHVDANHFKEAITDLNKVLEEYPNFVPGYYFRSEVKRKLNDVKGADKDYWYAFELEQRLRKQKEQGKIITGKEVVDSDSEQTEDDKTREKSDKSIEKFNRLVIYDKEEETQSKYKNEIRGRVQDKQVTVDLKPQFVITYYERLESIDNSVSRFDRMISEYNSRNVLKMQLKVIDNEASLTDEQAEYHFRSIDDYSLLLVKDSLNIDHYFGRGLDYMVLQDLSEAIDDYSRVINLDPNFAMAYFNRAVVRYKQMEISNYKENSDNLSLNIQKNSTVNPISITNPVSNPYAPSTLISDKEPDKIKQNYDWVLRDYETVIRLKPNFVYAYFNRGNIRCFLKDYRAAISDYDKAIDNNPDFAEAYFNRGLTRLYLGDTEQGIIDLSKAGELGMVDAYSIIKKMSAE
jgi:tetratricopeptide (TPR) repeat protein